jgi:hypothetical protein
VRVMLLFIFRLLIRLSFYLQINFYKLLFKIRIDVSRRRG